MERRAIYQATGLKAVLAAQGRRQDWLARQVGVSEQLISSALSGRRNLTREVAERVANVLGVPFFVVFDLSGDAVSPDAEKVEEAV